MFSIYKDLMGQAYHKELLRMAAQERLAQVASLAEPECQNLPHKSAGWISTQQSRGKLQHVSATKPSLNMGAGVAASSNGL